MSIAFKKGKKGETCPSTHPYCFRVPIGGKEPIETDCEGNPYSTEKALESLFRDGEPDSLTTNQAENISVDNDNDNDEEPCGKKDITCSCKQFDLAWFTIINDIILKIDSLKETISSSDDINVKEISEAIQQTPINFRLGTFLKQVVKKWTDSKKWNINITNNPYTNDEAELVTSQDNVSRRPIKAINNLKGIKFPNVKRQVGIIESRESTPNQPKLGGALSSQNSKPNYTYTCEKFFYDLNRISESTIVKTIDALMGGPENFSEEKLRVVLNPQDEKQEKINLQAFNFLKSLFNIMKHLGYDKSLMCGTKTTLDSIKIEMNNFRNNPLFKQVPEMNGGRRKTKKRRKRKTKKRMKRKRTNKKNMKGGDGGVGLGIIIGCVVLLSIVIKWVTRRSDSKEFKETLKLLGIPPKQIHINITGMYGKAKHGGLALDSNGQESGFVRYLYSIKPEKGKYSLLEFDLYDWYTHTPPPDDDIYRHLPHLKHSPSSIDRYDAKDIRTIRIKLEKYNLDLYYDLLRYVGISTEQWKLLIPFGLTKKYLKRLKKKGLEFDLDLWRKSERDSLFTKEQENDYFGNLGKVKEGFKLLELLKFHNMSYKQYGLLLEKDPSLKDSLLIYKTSTPPERFNIHDWMEWAKTKISEKDLSETLRMYKNYEKTITDNQIKEAFE